MSANSLRHGHSVGGVISPTYRSWQNMWTRCTNARVPHFARYGGRGITVCARWRSFDAFLADVGERPPGTTLDRINNALGYEPGNCRWATPKEQAQNRNTARGDRAGRSKLSADVARAVRQRFAAGGVTKAELARAYGVDPKTISAVLCGRTWRADLDGATP